jgi:hypothetical protein
MIIVAENCLDMSAYIQTHWTTHLRVSRLLNMTSVLDQRERETPKVVQQSLRMVPKYHVWIRKGPKPYQLHMGSVGIKLGQTGLFMGSSEYTGKVKPWRGPPHA